MSEFLTEAQLETKWKDVLDEESSGSIKDAHRRKVTAVVMENTERALAQQAAINEAVPASSTGNVGNYDPVLIGLIRRAMPKLMAFDLIGVQPMTMPTGLVFALRSRYTNASGAEALLNEADSGFSDGSGAVAGGNNPVGAVSGLSPWGSTPAFTRPGGVSTAAGEDFGGATTLNEMTFTIEKLTVTAKERALKAGYTVELAQDLRAVHGLDAEAELSNLLSNEVIAEINREVVRNVYTIATPGAQTNVQTAGTFDLDVDSNGRWSVERFKGMLFQIERDANRIAQTTRRGRGNFILCSADVASALAMSGKLEYAPSLSTDLTVDDMGQSFCGILNGKYKVYIDPYMANGDANQFALVGYKGSSAFDAGMFYCPYVPLTMYKAIDPTTFQPRIAFKTRYGIAGNPLNGANAADGGNAFNLVAGTNYYYRLMKVINLS